MACEALATLAQFTARYDSDDAPTPSEAEFDVAVDAAWIVLDALVSGASLRRCTTLGRPFVDAPCGSLGVGVSPLLGRRPGGRRDHTDTIPLPSWAISVHSVRLDGAPFSQWRMFSQSGVLRIGRVDDGVWPTDGATGNDSDLQVVLVTGVAPSLIAQNAALELVYDMLVNELPSTCRDSRAVASKVAQGVTVSYQDEESTDERFPWVRRLMAAYKTDTDGNKVADGARYYMDGLDGWEWQFEESNIDPAT